MIPTKRSCKGNMLKQKALELLVRVTKARWIIGTGEENNRELGFRICGLNFWYYKWPDPLVTTSPTYQYRVINKREFGETIQGAG